MSKTKPETKSSHQQAIDLFNSHNFTNTTINQNLFDKINQIENNNSSSSLARKQATNKKDIILYQNDYTNLITNKLADSHAVSILNNLNSKLNSSTSSLSNKNNNNNINYSAVAFSKPIAQSLNLNNIDQQILQKTPVNNRLIELSNGKTNTFNLTQSLTENNLNTINNTKTSQKDKSTSAIYSNQQLNRSIKTVLNNENEKKDYRNSIKKFYDLNLKSAQNNQQQQQQIQKTVLNEPMSELKSTRAITVKLFATNQFKMNLPPINKYKLFNNFDKKIGANRVGVVVGGPIFVAGENATGSKCLIKPSTTPNSVSRTLINRSVTNRTGHIHREKRTVSSSGRLIKKSPQIATDTSRVELMNNNNNNSTNFDNYSTNDELRFQIDKLCKISFNSQSKNGQNWSDNDSIYLSNDDYFFNNANAKSIILKNSSIINSKNKFDDNYILHESDNRSEKSDFNYASLDEEDENGYQPCHFVLYLVLFHILF